MPNSRQMKKFVSSKVAKLKVDRLEFERQAQALINYNEVYKDKTYRSDLVDSWVPDPQVPVVLSVVLNAVVAVPLEESPGEAVAEGPCEQFGALEDLFKYFVG